jgi:hypothetical protein
MVWDLGSEIRDLEKPIPDPGDRVKKAPDPGSPAPLLITSVVDP